MLTNAAAKFKYWQNKKVDRWEQIVECSSSKYRLHYFPKKGTLRLNPPNLPQRFIFDIRDENELIDVLLDLETAYEKATLGEKKPLTVLVIKQQRQTTPEQEAANFERIYKQNYAAPI